MENTHESCSTMTFLISARIPFSLANVLCDPEVPSLEHKAKMLQKVFINLIAAINLVSCNGHCLDTEM